MSGAEIWNWLKENSLAAAAAAAVVAAVAYALRAPTVAAFSVMLVGLLLILRAERDRQRAGRS
ncbi:hypothetical protein [Caldovatus aquaticus]|uniref:Uncharacterized protein n=1 Tax=Caldovatus aquaticus TaxID=2865671 RepID=A0ABS7F5L3_9PROT|nr:hypothetical protein [Caldovatus aquaticus]MBW8270900.1 hypothetical protein [Caldovatus aquaticus]